MRLHPSAVKKIVDLMTIHGGSMGERRLIEQLNSLDFSPYTKKTVNEGEMILVLTEDLVKALNQKPQ